MTHKTWVAALAPAHLAVALAGDRPAEPTYGDDGRPTHRHARAHHTALNSSEWPQLRPVAATIDLHPDTAAVLLARAKEPGMFPLAATLLLAGHATKLAPLVGDATSISGEVVADHSGRVQLTGWFDEVSIDWDDLLGALGAAEPGVRTMIIDGYLASGRSHGDLLDAVTTHLPALLAELDTLLMQASCWDARTAAHLVGDVLPKAGADYAWDRNTSHAREAHIPDLDTWAALTHPLGCERLAFAVSMAGWTQDVPASVVPALVKLARAHSPALMMSLLAAKTDLHIDVTGPELANLVCTHGALINRGGWVAELRPRTGYLLHHYGHLMDEPTKLAVMAGGDLGDMAQWCTRGDLGVADIGALRASLATLDRDTRHLLLRSEVHEQSWEAVVASPLLLELMMDSPAYLATLHSGDPRPGNRPTWTGRLHRHFRNWVRPQLGDDPDVWRTFSTLMENPGELRTRDLIGAALAVNIPASV